MDQLLLFLIFGPEKVWHFRLGMAMPGSTSLQLALEAAEGLSPEQLEAAPVEQRSCKLEKGLKIATPGFSMNICWFRIRTGAYDRTQLATIGL